MREQITLPEAARRTGTNHSTLRDWISRDIISGATEIISRGKAGGRKGYYPATILGEIETVKRMQADGLTLKTITKARALAMELMAEPTAEIDAKVIAETGPAARQWLSIYAETTGDPRAEEALERIERDISHLLTLVIRGMKYHMIDIIDRLPDVMENGTEKE
jgi:DNA-binding transcriptional MerR regulator